MPPSSTSAAEAAPSTRRFVRGSLGSGIGLGARAVGALALNKLLAVYGGPGGLTLLAHFQNLLALFTVLPNDGTHVGVVKYLAPLHSTSKRYSAWFGAAVALNSGVLLGGLLVLWLLPGPLVGVFQPTVGWLMLFGLGTILLAKYGLLSTVLLAASQLRAYIILTVVLSVGGPVAVAAVLLIPRNAPVDVSHVLLAYLLAQGCVLFPAFGLARHHGLLPSLRGRLSRVAVRGLSKFLLMAIGLLLFGKAVDFGVRELLVRQFGLAETDLWQAVVKLSDNYTMVLAAVMSSVYYPRLAALATQPAAQKQWVRTVLRILVPLLAAGLLLLYGLRNWLLPLVFEARFAAAADLLAPQLLADWFRFITWPLIMVFTAQARVGRYVAVQAGSAVLYAVALVLLLPRFGLMGALLAGVGRYALLLLWCAWYFRGYWRR